MSTIDGRNDLRALGSDLEIDTSNTTEYDAERKAIATVKEFLYLKAYEDSASHAGRFGCWRHQFLAGGERC